MAQPAYPPQLDPPAEPTAPPPISGGRRRWRVGSGIVLLVVSTLIWLGLLAVPFLPFSMTEKAAIGTGVFIAAEIGWWLGVLVLGPEVVRRLGRFVPSTWLHRKLLARKLRAPG